MSLSEMSAQRWNQMSPSQRRTLSQTISRGERVSDPDDARLAAEMAGAQASGAILSAIIGMVFLAAAMFTALGLSSWRAWVTVVLFSMVILPVSLAKWRRLRLAQEANCPG